jgi:acyl-coenzyme A thioesterase PaaI-like protein
MPAETTQTETAETVRASIQETLDNIKYVAWHDIKLISEDQGEGEDESAGSVTMLMPARDDLLNYVGTGHAGAIYTLAETAAGVTADSIAQTMDAYILLRGAEVGYTRRAEGDLTARGVVSTQAAGQAGKVFAASSRADFPVEVDIRDQEDKSVFLGTFNYALRPRS